MVKIVEFLQNIKVVIGMLVVLISALSASTYEVIDSHEELDELRAEYVIEVHPVMPEPIKPVEHKAYNHSQLIKQIRTLQNEVRRLREHH